MTRPRNPHFRINQTPLLTILKPSASKHPETNIK
jgi:hypothetical protein